MESLPRLRDVVPTGLEPIRLRGKSTITAVHIDGETRDLAEPFHVDKDVWVSYRPDTHTLEVLGPDHA